mmetsp:Transcript_35904/g.86660  ORF Transcript_35904/g.86660 Transcript_35904/m.86660 type:complete len:293 (+) Transcript_35904:251-1129(+)
MIGFFSAASISSADDLLSDIRLSRIGVSSFLVEEVGGIVFPSFSSEVSTLTSWSSLAVSVSVDSLGGGLHPSPMVLLSDATFLFLAAAAAIAAIPIGAPPPSDSFKGGIFRSLSIFFRSAAAVIAAMFLDSYCDSFSRAAAAADFLFNGLDKSSLGFLCLADAAAIAATNMTFASVLASASTWGLMYFTLVGVSDSLWLGFEGSFPRASVDVFVSYLSSLSLRLSVAAWLSLRTSRVVAGKKPPFTGLAGPLFPSDSNGPDETGTTEGALCSLISIVGLGGIVSFFGSSTGA